MSSSVGHTIARHQFIFPNLVKKGVPIFLARNGVIDPDFLLRDEAIPLTVAAIKEFGKNLLPDYFPIDNPDFESVLTVARYAINPFNRLSALRLKVIATGNAENEKK